MESNHEQINLDEFINERAEEILTIEKEIKTTTKKSMLFQRVPYFMRRRTRSHIKINKRRRKKHRHPLRSHVWYSKRFKMIKIFDAFLPYRRNIKSDSFIVKSQQRGFLFEESFKKVILTNKQHIEGINLEWENVLQVIWVDNEMVEIVVSGVFMLVILMNEDDFIKKYKGEILSLGCFSLFNCEESVDFFKFKRYFVKDEAFFIKSQSKDEAFFIKSQSEFTTGKVFMPISETIKTLYYLTNKRIIPISILELQRYSLENQFVVYPFDMVNSKYFKGFESELNRQLFEKYDRTPKGKRVSIEKEEMVINLVNEVVEGETERDLKMFYFKIIKGSVERSAYIYFKDEIIGRVIRGGFCFKMGVGIGLGYFTAQCEETEGLTIKNVGKPVHYKIEILKRL